MPVVFKSGEPAIATALETDRLKNLGMIGMKAVNLNGVMMIIMRRMMMKYEAQIIITIEEPWDADDDVYTSLKNYLKGLESKVPKVTITIETFERITNRRKKHEKQR